MLRFTLALQIEWKVREKEKVMWNQIYSIKGNKRKYSTARANSNIYLKNHFNN